MRRARSTVARMLACLALFFAADGTARAQTNAIEPKHVTVTQSREGTVVLQCFAGAVWYPVAELERGQVLLADATRDGFYRVAYPRGVPVIISLANGRLNEGEGTVTLTNATDLRARNIRRTTLVDSYKNVLERKLPAGTDLPSMGVMREEGKVTGFFVEPPDAARAWINARHVRDATPREIEAFTSADKPETASDPRPEDKEPQAEPEQAQTDRAPAPTDSDQSEQGDSAQQPTDEQTQPDERDAPATDRTPDEAPDEASSPDAPETESPEQKRAGIIRQLDQLDEAYEDIREQRTVGAEITPLISEYTQLRDEARALADGDADMTRIAEYAQARIELLRLRAEVQRARTRLAQLQEQTDETAIAITQARQNLIRARGYEMVGVLTRSSLYTGEALPLRYRLQSSDATNARTIAYIEVDPDTDIRPLLGEEVGVIPVAEGVKRGGPIPLIEAAIIERTPDLSESVDD